MTPQERMVLQAARNQQERNDVYERVLSRAIAARQRNDASSMRMQHAAAQNSAERASLASLYHPLGPSPAHPGLSRLQRAGQYEVKRSRK
jgi:hypothetical protein